MLHLVCIICHEALNETSEVYATQCGHIFHKSCICQWLSSNSTCPQCRKACNNSTSYKLYIDAALETLNDTASQLVPNNSAIDLYEEVNLNLKRDLELSETSLALCQSSLIDLEQRLAEVEIALMEETKMKETCEKRLTELEKDKARVIQLNQSFRGDYIRVQNDLKREIEKRTITNKEIDDLKKHNMHLNTVIRRLETKSVQSHPVAQSKGPGTTEERIAALEKRLEKEIEAREQRETQPLVQKDESMDLATGAILFGIPQSPDENLKSILEKLCQVINCKLPNLRDIYRTRQRNNRNSNIMIKFESPMERNGVLIAYSAHQKKIRRELTLNDLGIAGSLEKKVYMREPLTPENSALLQQATRMKYNKQLAAAYTHFGAVYVKLQLSESGTRIENQEMLNAIVSKKNTTGQLGRAISSSSFSEQAVSRDSLDSFLDSDS